jgi:hypothetical protein
MVQHSGIRPVPDCINARHGITSTRSKDQKKRGGADAMAAQPRTRQANEMQKGLKRA